MEKKSVLICEYCGGLINQEKTFMHEIERDANKIDHEGFYHSECFINSIIKDLERLDFKVIRPRSEFHKEEDPEPLGFPMPDIATVLNMAEPFLKSLGSEETKDLQKKKEEAFKKLQSQNGKQKREERKQAVVVIDSIDIEIYDLIKKNPDITIGEVKEKLNITHASLTPHLKRLEEMDLIKRIRDQQTIHLEVTDKPVKPFECVTEPFLKSLGSEETKDLQKKKEEAFKKLQSQNGKQKREERKKAVGKRKNK